ncbi:MAG: hypothetical protein JWO41_680 [Candidatus Saccharibacteria bacterium]|nr:hypothetical protein [Candidatus Saccharibacteria bacterium]
MEKSVVEIITLPLQAVRGLGHRVVQCAQEGFNDALGMTPTMRQPAEQAQAEVTEQ